MKRRSLVGTTGLSISVLLLSLLVCGFAQGQKRGTASISNKIVSSDWRYPELVAKAGGDDIDVGDGFKASHLDGETVTVSIPGAYSDTLKGTHGHGLGFQLASIVFVKVNAAPTTDAGEAMKSYYLGEKDVRQGNGEVKEEHSFRLSNGRAAHIFVYWNDWYGLLAIVKTGPASRKK